MGASESKDDKLLHRFSTEEKEKISNFVKVFPDKCVDKAALNLLVEDALPERLTEEIHRQLGTPNITYERFVFLLAIVLKGSAAEKKELFLDFMTKGRDTVSCADLKEFLNDTSSALYQQLITQPNTAVVCCNWKFKYNDTIQRRFRKLFILDLCPKDCGTIEQFSVPRATLEQNLKESSLTFAILCVVYHNAFLKLHQGSEALTVKLPTCSEERYISPYMDLPSVLLINSCLPPTLQNEWKLLYNSDMHGESYNTMLKMIVDRGPTVLIIKDKGGAIFGGFADTSWNLKPAFFGGANCFIFTLFPKLARFFSSGYNSNYMYLCRNQMTLPNGIGFGGQFNNFALWLSSDLKHGHSMAPCATYQSTQLSSAKDFVLDTIEVWRVGPHVEPTPPTDRRSVLDKDMTAKALLTVVDRIGASDGLREEEHRIEQERKHS